MTREELEDRAEAIVGRFDEKIGIHHLTPYEKSQKDLVVKAAEDYKNAAILEVLERIEKANYLVEDKKNGENIDRACHNGSWLTWSTVQEEIEAIRKEING